MIKIKLKKRLTEQEAPTNPIDILDLGLYVKMKGATYNLVFVDMKNFSKVRGSKTIWEVQKTNPVVVGYLQLELSLTDGDCFNTLKVKYSAVHESYAGKGLGTELYKIAMAYATTRGKSGIRSDTKPSDSAQGVWRKLEADPTITKTFDLDGEPIDSPIESGRNPRVMGYFDYKEPRETDPEIDDCVKPGPSNGRDALNRGYASKASLAKLNLMIARFKKSTNPNVDAEDLLGVAEDLFGSRF